MSTFVCGWTRLAARNTYRWRPHHHRCHQQVQLGQVILQHRHFARTAARVKPSHRQLQRKQNDEDEDDDDGDDSEILFATRASEPVMEPWKTLLERPARAGWRVTDTNIVLVDQARNYAIQQQHHRIKTKHLRRIYEQDVIAVQQNLANRRENHRKELVRNPHHSNEKDGKDESSPAAVPVYYGREQVSASLHFRFLSNYAVTKRVLEETQSLLGRPLRPRKILDFGMGCGSATVACLDVVIEASQDENSSSDSIPVEWIHGVDASLTMQQGAECLLQEYLRLLQEQNQQQQKDKSLSTEAATRLTFSSHLSISADGGSGGFDIALFCYTAMELPHSTSTLAAAALLWDKLAPNGLFVMIEPGTPDGFASIRTVRNLLLATNQKDDEDGDTQKVDREEYCQILAPCTHNGSCPIERFPLRRRPAKKKVVVSSALDDGSDSAGDNDHDSSDDDEVEERFTKKGFCSFVQSMPPRDGRNKSEKFSYLVAQKRSTTENDNSHVFTDSNIARLLEQTTRAVDDMDMVTYNKLSQKVDDLEQQYIDSTQDDLGLEFLQGDDNRSSHGRIIHAPRKKKGHVLIECCAPPGRISRHKISKSMSKMIPGIYAAARKSRWGGLWPDVKAYEG